MAVYTINCRGGGILKVFNYSNYAKIISLGMTRINMTRIAQELFQPIVSRDDVLNQNGEPYCIDSRLAGFWYKKQKEIPKRIKDATSIPEVAASIGNYFEKNILGKLINDLEEKKVTDKMAELVQFSDLSKDKQEELLEYYKNDDVSEFLGRSFLYALLGDNKKIDPSEPLNDLNMAIEAFDDIVQKARKKPKSITPPEKIAEDEIGYVSELYRVYEEKIGVPCICPEDLECNPRIQNNFNRQRKSYYCAETIRRELRDTVLDETDDDFSILKDEIYDGVIDTCDHDYADGFSRLNSVMQQASQVSISNNAERNALNWVGPAEKKGVCHMLVNDKRLFWMEPEYE